jgi:antitoxin VapB
MALSIKDPETDRLARELAAITGEPITTAIKIALKQRIEQLAGRVPHERRQAAVATIVKEFAALPVLDDRAADEIAGYNEHGHFDSV